MAVKTEPLTAEAFATYGDVIGKAGAESFPINNGRCMRFHDLADVSTLGPTGRPMISIASSEPYSFPLTLDMVERHPLGSQAFIPLSNAPFVVIVCDDLDGRPDAPKAFLTDGRQGINYRPNIWHGVLTPLNETADFIIVDRGGEGNNLEEYFFPEPFTVQLD